MNVEPLSPELLNKMDAWWHAANYLSVGQIYLYDNPLLAAMLETTPATASLSDNSGDNSVTARRGRFLNG